MANETSITWKTTGRKLDKPDDPRPSIDITEHPRSFSMGEGSEPYGIAIDAPLAVSMIKALSEKVSKQPPDNELRQLMEGSFAITLDKNVLLKTISQPKCEGIRFYLCLKKSDKGEDLLSLVTVGVDETGKDLLYEYQSGLPVQNIPTRSLVAEYGYPPGKLQQSGPALDPFVLFKFSQ
jgi:hypothetical protein